MGVRSFGLGLLWRRFKGSFKVVVLVGLVLLRDAIGASLFRWNHPNVFLVALEAQGDNFPSWRWYIHVCKPGTRRTMFKETDLQKVETISFSLMGTLQWLKKSPTTCRNLVREAPSVGFLRNLWCKGPKAQG
jgi:hypothetical protein